MTNKYICKVCKNLFNIKQKENIEDWQYDFCSKMCYESFKKYFCGCIENFINEKSRKLEIKYPFMGGELKIEKDN